MPLASRGSSARRSGGSSRHRKKSASVAGVAANIAAQGDETITATCQVSRFHTDANEDYASSEHGIDLKLVSINVAGQELLEDATISLQPGHIYGLMGANGVGKTTLLRQLAIPGKLVPPHLSTLLVEQEDVGDGRSALETILSGDKEMVAMLARESVLQAADDSQDVWQATAALAHAKAQQLEHEAAMLARLVDKTSGARGQGHRFRWQDAEKLSKEAQEISVAYRWVQAEENALAAEAEAGTSAPELRKKARPVLGMRVDTSIPLEGKAARLRAEADRLRKLVDASPGAQKAAEAAQESKQHGGAGSVERSSSSASEVWDSLADALSAVRLEMAEAGKDKEEAEARASAILTGLGFTPEMAHSTPTRQLSGGWRMRVALGRALFMNPALLMLDEPTNHLDLPAILWLERWLAEEVDTRTAILIVSHDRAFLDNVCTDIMRMVNHTVEYYLGMDFTTYSDATEDRCAAAERESQLLERRRKTMQKSIEAMAAKAHASGDDKRLKQAAARRRKMEERLGVEHNAKGNKFQLNRDMAGLHNSVRQTHVDSPAIDPSLRLELPSAEPLGYYGAVLQLDGVAVGWDPKEPPLVANVTLEIDMASRIGILGRNGGGKSTLMAAIAGDLKPLKGEIQRHHNLRIGYFSQHHIDSVMAQTMPGTTPVDFMMTKFAIKEQETRAFLAKFGLSGRLAVQPIGTLSGGQKARLSLALLFWKPPHILLLDEPTNHLDVQTVSALGRALEDFDGGLVLISHDRKLLSDTCSEFFSVTRTGRLKPLDDGVSQYVRSVTKNL